MYEIIRQLRNATFVDEIEIVEFIDEQAFKLLKIKAFLSDHSLLYIHELHTDTYQKYSYHWQKENGELIIRWDNKPHWKDLCTFPHHKHVGTLVVESPRIMIQDVLKTIEGLFAKEK